MEPIKVISHIELSQDIRQKIEKTWIKKHKGESLSFDYSVDSRILGGVLIIDNGVYFDATVKSTLNQIKSIL